MASRLENLPMPAFLTNPTKISNALRQIRAPLRCDALTCYFDPMLEADALAAANSAVGNSANEPVPSEEVVKQGRVPIAIEVIRRLKGLLRDEMLLSVTVSGPLTLAAHANLAEFDIDFAGSLVTEFAKAFAEAGANLIFLREEARVVPEGPAGEVWKTSLTPIFNIVHFYESIPILQVTSDDTATMPIPQLSEALLSAPPDSVVCLPLTALQNISAESRALISGIYLGISLPTEAFGASSAATRNFDPMLTEAIREFRPAIVTTANDLPATTDPKRVPALSEIVRNAR
jgi:uroporphyrinogen-III decarboxylase